MTRDLAKQFENKNFIMIYPEQKAVELQEENLGNLGCNSSLATSLVVYTVAL